jgi:hypothetical protein
MNIGETAGMAAHTRPCAGEANSEPVAARLVTRQVLGIKIAVGICSTFR